VSTVDLRSEVVDLLQRLIRVDTVNPPGNETIAAELLRDYLAEAGVQVGVHPDADSALWLKLAGIASVGTITAYGRCTIGEAFEDPTLAKLMEGACREVVAVAASARPGVHAAEELPALLPGADAVVVLLPLNDATRGMVDAELLGRMHDGALLINAGRGGLQVEDDILATLDDGTLLAATLDVFHAEPLPADSPFWSHPKVTLSPHNAADTDPDAISLYVAEQIARHERSEPLENLVDRSAGY